MSWGNVLNVSLMGGTFYYCNKMEGMSSGSALLKSVGDTALWSIFPQTMAAVTFAPMAVGIARGGYEAGESKFTRFRNMARPYNTSFEDTQINQQYRYSQIQELNMSGNIARSQSRRMRGV